MHPDEENLVPDLLTTAARVADALEAVGAWIIHVHGRFQGVSIDDARWASEISRRCLEGGRSLHAFLEKLKQGEPANVQKEEDKGRQV